MIGRLVAAMAAICLVAATLAPARADDAAETLLAMEAVRSAASPSLKNRAAIELETLAIMGAPGAASGLARLLYEGVIEGSAPSARKWARQAVERGELESYTLLSQMKMLGFGGPKDVDRAALLAREAAVMGSPGAAVLLFELLDESSQAEAGVRYLERAADAGHAPAQLIMGLLHANAEIDGASMEMALFWFLLAGANGDESAGALSDAAASQLGQERTLAVLDAALEWNPK